MRFRFSRRQVLVPAFALLLATLLPAVSFATEQKQYFVAAPYVQLGYHFKGNNLTVSWLTEDGNTDDVIFEYKAFDAKDWQKAEKIEKGSLNGYLQATLMSVEMLNLSAGTVISYRISKGGAVIFQAATPSIPAAGAAIDFAVFGDVGHGSEGESKIAAILKDKHPAMSIITGDIVYPIGSVRNYLKNFFPYLNNEGGSVRGSAVLQSMLTVCVSGNHDLTEGGGIDARDLDLAPDSMAYYVLWKQPLNGHTTAGGANIPVPRGDKEKIDSFLKASAEAYPRMTNFSYDYGDCHVLVLDANSYMDWTDATLRKWVEDDLTKSNSCWKFVAFHQPGFNSDWSHREEQRMRHLCDIFEKCGVDLCFSGHTHSYQRSYPLRFKEASAPTSDKEASAGYVYGTFKIDKTFDGDKNTKPAGVIYVISGGGGATLSNSEIDADPGQWLPFTKFFDSKDHSVTICHIEGKRFNLQQIGVDGKVLDQFTINK